MHGKEDALTDFRCGPAPTATTLVSRAIANIVSMGFLEAHRVTVPRRTRASAATVNDWELVKRVPCSREHGTRLFSALPIRFLGHEVLPNEIRVGDVES
jgi:hypothetical protein